MIKILLQLFAGEGAGEGTTGETAEAAQMATEANQKILYGKNNEVQETEPEEVPSPEVSRKDDYKRFKKEFADEYQSDLQRVIDKRFKNSKKTEARLTEENEKYRKVFSLLSKHYGVSDIDALEQKLFDDESFYSEKALQNDMTTAQYKQQLMTSLKEEELDSQIKTLKAAEDRQKQIEKWDAEFDELLETYPDVDLEEEMQNEKFVNAVHGGMSIRDAFQMVHFDEWMSCMIRYTSSRMRNA